MNLSLAVKMLSSFASRVLCNYGQLDATGAAMFYFVE